MEKQILFTETPEKFYQNIEKAVRKVLNEKENNEFEKQLFNRKQASEIFNIHPTTLTNKIDAGYIKTTPDGKFISGAEINRYLGIADNKKAVSNGNLETA